MRERRKTEEGWRGRGLQRAKESRFSKKDPSSLGTEVPDKFGDIHGNFPCALEPGPAGP